MSKHHVAEIKNILNRLFSDTSVRPDKTRAELEEIKDEVDSLLDALPPTKVLR